MKQLYYVLLSFPFEVVGIKVTPHIGRQGLPLSYVPRPYHMHFEKWAKEMQVSGTLNITEKWAKESIEMEVSGTLNVTEKSEQSNSKIVLELPKKL